MTGKRNIGFNAVLAASGLILASGMAKAVLPPVPVPPENPITEPKRVLGKMLFWDEQLSADNTVACATCHQPARGGTDGRRARNAGADGILNTADDSFGSPGVLTSDSNRAYYRNFIYALQPQVTPRGAPSPIDAAYAPNIFWDGRATSQYTDPLTNQVVIQQGGALESQIKGPPTSSVEMGHDAIDWVKVTTKLAEARPLATATNLPTDVSNAIQGHPTYGDLFARAFGDSQVTASRVSMAIATYERTLIADQTPFDLGTLTPNQQQGLNIMNANNCTQCHTPPLFTDQSFRNIGLRPVAEDTGRSAITGNNADRGKFKVPSLRNVVLQTQYMHNGMFVATPQTPFAQVFGFYNSPPPGAPGSQQFADNQDPIMATVHMPANQAGPVVDFLSNGLTDPRVRNESFPFDHPTLYTNRPADQPASVAAGTVGSGGVVPAIIAVDPPFVGNQDFRIGLDRARGATTARLVWSATAPDATGTIPQDHVFSTKVVGGTGNGNGYATEFWPLLASQVSSGQTIYAQWLVDDAAATGGVAKSNVARITFFCGSVGCPAVCQADVNETGNVTVDDLFVYLHRWFALDATADMDRSGTITVQDLFTFLGSWFAGC